MNFCSDNVTGCAPEILEALARANRGAAMPYGADDLTAKVERRIAELFEHEVAVFLVATGSSANALALSCLTPPFGAIYSHPAAHVMVDECGAPEFYSGGAKMVGVPGAHGKIAAADLDKVLALLPALQRPTISSLSDAEWVAVNTIIEERTVRDLIPRLKAANAHGIVEYPLNKIVL